MKPGEFAAIVSSSTQPPKRSRTGIFSRIVCEGCEKSFHADDEYLIAFLRNLDSAIPLFPERPEAASAYPGFCGKRLSRSVLSVLFRAHLSDHEVYRRIVLGPLAAPLRTFLREPLDALPPCFGVALRHIDAPIGGVFHNPFREKYGDGVNFVRFYFPYLTAIIRTDFRKESPFQKLELDQRAPVIAMRSTRLSSSEMDVLSKLLSKHGNAISKMFAPFASNHS